MGIMSPAPNDNGRTIAVAGSLMLMLASAVGCHSTGPQIAGLEDAALVADGHVQVQLTWRLFETMHSLDSEGQDRTSAVFELLVNGGTPSRVALGRRASAGCVVHDGTGAAEDPSVIASLDCHAMAHGESARVQRSSPGELLVEAFGQDEAQLGRETPRMAVKVATVKIPVDADVLVEHGVLTIPDESPGTVR